MKKCIFNIHGISTSPLLEGRNSLPRFDAAPLELAESLLAIAVFCCDLEKKNVGENVTPTQGLLVTSNWGIQKKVTAAESPEKKRCLTW